MIRLLKIEWLKLRHFKAFWILLLSFTVVSILVGSCGTWILRFLKNEGAEFNGISPAILPLYDFPDVWQNIAYILGYFKVILAFILVISISNEFNYRLLRQNIIDGLSKKEWMVSKILTMAALSIFATILLFLIGLVNGLILSHPDGYAYIFSNMDILLGYCLEIFVYLAFATFIALIIRKPGIVIIGLMIYTLMFEPFLTFFITYFEHMPDWIRPIANYFPIRSLMNLIHPPYPRYIFSEIQDYISLKETLIVLGWLFIYFGTSYWILKRKDL